MGSKGPTADPANQDPNRRRLRQSRERARGRDVEKPHRIDERLRELAVAYGVATAYLDEEGTRRRVTSQSLQRVLEVLGVQAKTAEDFGQNEACTRSAAEPMTREFPQAERFLLLGGPDSHRMFDGGSENFETVPRLEFSG